MSGKSGKKASREIGRMSARTVASALKKPGLHHDGGGLYLQVGERRSEDEPPPASWIYRYKLGGKERQMGLGPANFITLADARLAAAECRRQRWAGKDPIEERKAARQAAALERAKAVTFRAAAELYIGAHEAGWKNDKHKDQWRATLQTYAHPVFGGLPVAEIDTALVMKVVEPIWTTKTETASRVRGRIESILDWATTRGFRKGDNPARWKGHLDTLLPARMKVAQVEHHAALPYATIGDFMIELRKESGVAAAALEFTILCAVRTGEVIGAQWSEIDLEEKLWTVPPERMKARREHRVPLSAAAAAVLKRMAKVRAGETPHVFPGGRRGRPLSNMAMAKLLQRMGRDDVTVHGFRSTFRDWAAETGKPEDIAEAALAHIIRDKTVAAYQRGDLLERRRALMSDWAAFCATPAGKGSATGTSSVR